MCFCHSFLGFDFTLGGYSADAFEIGVDILPIEREFKYVLRDADELWSKLDPITTPGLISGRANIDQGYISKGGRIRLRSWQIYKGQILKEPKVERIFTYKHDLTNQPGCLEIETPMSEEDYLLAWEEADHKILKTRFLLPCNNTSGVWEIDFFRDQQGIYLAMAEFEVPAKAGPPERLHPLVSEYLRFAVPEDDGRFKNRKLCERTKVSQLLKEIA